MICETCKAEGKKSRVFGGDMCTRTLMSFQQFYDEDGRLHRHDPNVSTTPYSCSNGHRWTVKESSPCPQEDCTFNRPKSGDAKEGEK